MIADLLDIKITPVIEHQTGEKIGAAFEFTISVRTGHSETTKVFVTGLSTKFAKTEFCIKKCSNGRAVRRDSALYASAKACARESLMAAATLLAATAD